MRRILGSMLVLGLLFGVAVSGYANTRTIYSEEKSFLPQDDFKKYIRVKNNSDDGASLSNGDLVVWDVRNASNTATDPSDRWSVTTTTVASDPLVAGVMTETTAQGSYGWLQRWGIHNAVRVNGVVGRGNAVDTSTTRGRGKVASTAAGSYGNFGVNLADQGASGNNTTVIFLKTE